MSLYQINRDNYDLYSPQMEAKKLYGRNIFKPSGAQALLKAQAAPPKSRSQGIPVRGLSTLSTAGYSMGLEPLIAPVIPTSNKVNYYVNPWIAENKSRAHMEKLDAAVVVGTQRTRGDRLW